MGPKDVADKLNEQLNGKKIEINRAQRRQAPATDVKFTKATHSIKKQRNKNAKKREQNQRKLARARKISQNDNSQES